MYTGRRLFSFDRELGTRFVAGADDIVYEKDLGADTVEAAKAIRDIDAPAAWRRVD